MFGGLLAIGAGSALVACGADESGSADGPGQREVTLVLDFLPNPGHAGIYLARERGYYADRGIRLEIIEPSSTSDTLKLIEAGKADFGIADGIDLARQISRGRPVKGVMALTQRPSGGLITLSAEQIESPRDLDGRTVGVTGVPSDDVILDTVVANGGGDPETIDRVTIGFNGVQNLRSGEIDALTGFIPVEGPQLATSGYPVRSFAIDEFGGPRYPGLVAFSSLGQINSSPELMLDFVNATVRGYRDTLTDSSAALNAFLAANPAIERDFASASLDAYLPLFQADAPQYGGFQRNDLVRLMVFLERNRLIEGLVAPSRFGTDEFLPDGR